MNRELLKAYQYVPKRFHWILKKMENNELKVTNVRSCNQKLIMNVIALAKWMNLHYVCQPFWIQMLYQLIKSFKLTVLRALRPAFQIILGQTITQWLSSAIDVVKLLFSIGKQISKHFLYAQVGLTDLSQIMRLSLINMTQAISTPRQLVQINNTQRQIYRFIIKAGYWVKNCRLIMEQINNQQKTTFHIDIHFQKYQLLKEHHKYIQSEIKIQMNCFQSSYYNDSINQFKNCEKHFIATCQLKDPKVVAEYLQSMPNSNKKRDNSLPNNEHITKYVTSEELYKTYELGKEFSQRYKRIPKELRYVCELLQNSNSRYVPCKKKVDPNELILDVQELCVWLSKHLLAKKIWFRIVQRLLPVFKLSILCFLKDSFRRIFQSSKKIKLFKRRGQKLIAMIWKIILQVGKGSWFISFNLNYEWKLCQKLNMDHFCVNKIQQSGESLNVKLTPSELQVYRLIMRAQKWAMKLRKSLNYKICMKSFKSSELDLQGYEIDLKQIQIERKRVWSQFAADFNIFERKFYGTNLVLYFKVKEEFQNLIEKIQRRERKKAIRESETNDPQFSEDSETQQQKHSHRDESESHKSYQQSEKLSHSRECMSESQVESSASDNQTSSIHNSPNNQQLNPLKRQWIARYQEYDNQQEDEEEGEMSMDDIYVMPPSRQEIEERKKQFQQDLVKKEVTVKEQHIQKLRNSIRQKIQWRQQAKMQYFEETVSNKQFEESRKQSYSRSQQQQESPSEEQEGQVGYSRGRFQFKGQKRTAQQRSKSPQHRKIYDMILLDD